MTEDEIAGWHHRLDGHEFGWTPGVWWWTGWHGVLQFMGSQRVRHSWATELNWTEGQDTEITIRIIHHHYLKRHESWSCPGPHSTPEDAERWGACLVQYHIWATQWQRQVWTQVFWLTFYDHSSVIYCLSLEQECWDLDLALFLVATG